MSDVIFPEPEEEQLGQLVPEDDEPLDPEQEALETERELELFPEAEDLVVAEERPPLGRSWAFDFAAGRFLVSGSTARGPLATWGDATLRGWIAKALRTARGAHPIHPDDYGMEAPYGPVGRPVTLGAGGYEQDVRDALTYHPLIQDVIDFRAEADPDEEFLAVSFTVVREDGDTFTVTEEVPSA
jgi:hypothetical protein